MKGRTSWREGGESVRSLGAGRAFWALSVLLLTQALAPGAWPALAAVGGAPAGSLWAQEERALAIMEDTSRRYLEIQAFCAHFSQTLEVPLLNETHTSSGRLCQSQPDLFSMRWSDPQGDVVVADGEYFWVYYPSADPKQVLQFSMEVRPGGLDFQREFLEDPGRKYTLDYIGTEMVGGHETHVISATPRQRSGFTQARLWLDVDASLIRQARIGMENGSVRTVTLSDIQLNPPSDPDRFSFTPPEGTLVIRRGP